MSRDTVATQLSRKARRQLALELACRSAVAAVEAPWESLETRVMMAVTPPVLVYNFEDPSAGTTVANTGSGGAGYAGTLAGDALPTFSSTGPSPAGGQFMHFVSTEATPGATFENTGGRVDSATLLNPILGGTGTVASYMRTTQIGHSDAWQAPGVTGAEQAGAGDDIFWSNLDPQTRPRMRAGDGPIATGPSIGDGAWHHVVSTRNKDTGLERVYVDGILGGSTVGITGQKGANFRAIGATTDVAGNLTDIQGYNYYTGDLDKVEVYSSELTPQEVAAAYAVPTTAVPAAPTGVTGSSPGALRNTISIPAAPAAQGVAGYVILAGTSAAGPFTEIGVVGSNGTNPAVFSDRAVTPGQTKFYIVRAFNSTGTSADSSPAVSVTTATAGEGATAQYFNDSWWGGGTSLENGASTILVLRVGSGDVRKVVSTVDFDWGTGSPDPAIRGDQHSSVFTGRIVLPADADGDGTPGESIDVQFVSNTDDDGYLFVEDDTGAQVLASTDPGGHGQRDATVLQTVTITEGRSYDFIQLQHEGGGGSGSHMRWDNPATGARETVPETMLQTAMDTTEAGGLKRPTTLAATETTDTNVTFSFTDASSNETRFELLRSAGATFNEANASVVGTAGINATEIRDAQVVAGVWSYAIRAVNVDGASPASTPLNNVTVPARAATTGANAYYFNSSAWNGGRIGNFAGSGPEVTKVLAGAPDLAAHVDTIDVDFASTGDAPDPLINTDFFGTVYTGKVLIPSDFDGDGTPGEVVQVQFVGNTDDHGFYFVNGKLAAVANYPRGQGDYRDAGPTTLTEGQSYDFVVFQEEIGGGAGVHFKWQNLGNANAVEVIPVDNLTPATGAPAAPTAALGVGLPNAIAVTYTDNATNEVRYEIERAEVVGGTPGAFQKIADAPVNSTTYADTTAQAGKTYRYRVVAVNFEGRSPAATTADATLSANQPVPFAPTNFTVSNQFNRNLLSFTDNAVNDVSYIVQRRLAANPGDPFVAAAASPIPGNGLATGQVSFTDTDPSLLPGTSYVYRIAAVNSEGEQSPFVESTATVIPSFRSTFYPAQYTAGAGPAVVRGDPTVNYGWGTGRPDPAIQADDFSVWFEGTYTAPVAGSYTFAVTTDDGERLFIDGALAVNQWVDQGDTRVAADPVTLTAGQQVELRFQMYERGGGATARLTVTGPDGVEVPVQASGGPNLAAPLRAPINVVAVSGADTDPAAWPAGTAGDSIGVHWLDTTANETGFEVLRSTAAAGPFAPVGTVAKDANAFYDQTGVQGQTYFYQVRALNGATQGPVSATTVDAVGPAGTSDTAPVNFADFSAQATQDQWVLQQGAGATGAPPAFVDDDGDGNLERLRMTNNENNSWGSAYLATPRRIDGFSASFDFQETTGSGDPADGFTFIIQQNDPATPAAVGGGGGAMGWVGVRNSFAVKFDNYPGKLNQVGVYHDGTDIFDDATDPRNQSVPTGSFDFESGARYHVTANYDNNAKTLTLTIDDIGNDATAPFVKTWNVDIPQLVQSGSAYVGFTAATGGENIKQDILSFAFSNQTNVPAAKVTQVFVNGQGITGQTTANGIAFRNLAGVDNTFGYPAPGGANQLKSIPWSNGINKISLRFDQDVAATLGQGDLVVRGINTANYAISGFSYDAATKTGTWTLTTPIINDKVNLFLDDALVGGLDGEWTTGQAYPSGNGTAGGDFTFRLNVQRGDANQDGSVNALDLGQLKAKLNRTATNPGTGTSAYSVFADLNADGQINALDLGIAKARLNNRLPNGEPASLFSSLPVTR